MQTTYFVSHAGQTYGPWTIAEITTRIAQMELLATDYIYEEAASAWVPLLECKAITEALKLQRPTMAPPSAPPPARNDKAMAAKVTSEQATLKVVPTPTPSLTPEPLVIAQSEDASSGSAEWFVQKESHRYGPFTYQGLIKALQEKSVFDYDLVWRKGMEKWVRLAEHEQFSADAIRDLKDKENGKVFFERKYPRIAVKSDVIVHDNRSVWLGQTYQGSEGGSGMTVRNATLVPGQVLFLHFTGFESIPAFNALCEVVSKKYVPNIRDPRSAVPYGMKFVKLDKHVQDAMREFYKAKAN